MGDGYRQHKQTFEVRISSKHLFIHYCTEVGIHCREEFLEKKKLEPLSKSARYPRGRWRYSWSVYKF